MYEFVVLIEFFDRNSFCYFVPADSYSEAVCDAFNYLKLHKLVGSEDPSCKVKAVYVHFSESPEEVE